MTESFGGWLGMIAIVVAVVVVLGLLLAVLRYRFRIFRRPKGHVRGSKHDLTSNNRVEVLETTVIDAERKLVLIRCDRIEHLIMVGGPADLVVENDVRKVRGVGAPPAKIPGFDTDTSARSAGALTTVREPAAQALPKPAEPVRSSLRHETERAAAPAPRPPLREAVPSPTRALAQPQPQPIEPRAGRRDLVPARRTPAPAARVPAPVPQQPAAGADRAGRGARNGRSEPTSLPAAQIPWSDPDSIENEIVRALRFDPQVRSGGSQPARHEPPALKTTPDSQTTLGDLADRLEEALAREVQSASQASRSEPAVDDFGFESQGGPAAEEPHAPPAAQPERQQAERQERRERGETQRSGMASAPEPENRRDSQAQSERREEAPVISLNARRRESADQLEDEMARLLGELTSDNKGR